MKDNYDTKTDEELMAAIQKGDHQSFCVLVRRHTEMFYASAYRTCHNQDEAEDAVQDAFLKLWKKPEIWNPNKGAKFTTWFYRVVVNAATDQMRKRKNNAGEYALDNLADIADAQDETMQADEEQSALEGAIENLPERQKMALNLCFYEGLSNKDAAEMLGVGIKALESLLMRAKAGLKETLIDQGFIEKEEKYGS